MAAIGSHGRPRRSRCSRSCKPSRDRSRPWSDSMRSARVGCSARTKRTETARALPSFSGPASMAGSPRRWPGPPWPTWSSSPRTTRSANRWRVRSRSRPAPPLRQRRHMADLEIRNLHVSAEDKRILKGLDLDVSKGEVHALMGPNGSGKSTLANAIMGHPSLEVTEGEIRLRGADVTEADPEERARAGLFMAFQYPVAIPGVTVAKYLRMAVNAHREARGESEIKLKDFRKETEAAMELMSIPREFSSRYLNDGFSGGEKKRMEILQLAMLLPELAVLDETDSGLDIDALRTVAEGVNTVAKGSDMGVLIITHYQRILHMVEPQFVHIMFEGRIVKEGGPELVEQLEKRGYGWIRDEVAAAA